MSGKRGRLPMEWGGYRETPKDSGGIRGIGGRQEQKPHMMLLELGVRSKIGEWRPE